MLIKLKQKIYLHNYFVFSYFKKHFLSIFSIRFKSSNLLKIKTYNIKIENGFTTQNKTLLLKTELSIDNLKEILNFSKKVPNVG